MIRYVRQIVISKATIPDAIRRLRAEIRRERDAAPDAMRLAEDLAPEAYFWMQRCGAKANISEHATRPDTYKVSLSGCHQVPWCVRCVATTSWRRVASAMDALCEATPAGSPMRLVHIVQTAPLTLEGKGWGWKASEDPRSFAALVYEHLRNVCGDGIGVIASYQDIGERAFAKRHPHVDLTLNAWQINGDGCREAKPIDVTNGGRGRWDEAVAALARQRFEPDARRGSVHIGHMKSTMDQYLPILRYQMREMVDLRKAKYERDKARLWWCDYSSGDRQKLTLTQFGDGLADYEQRLGKFGTRALTDTLHHRYGHLSDRLRKATSARTGGAARRHKGSCWCSQCHDWTRSAEADDTHRVKPFDD